MNHSTFRHSTESDLTPVRFTVRESLRAKAERNNCGLSETDAALVQMMEVTYIVALCDQIFLFSLSSTTRNCLQPTKKSNSPTSPNTILPSTSDSSKACSNPPPNHHCFVIVTVNP